MSEAQMNQKAWGHGLASKSPNGTVLDVWFPEPCLGEAPMSDLQWFPPKDLDLKAGSDELRNLTLEVVRVEIDLTNPVESTADAYLRLALTFQVASYSELNQSRRLDPEPADSGIY